MTHEFHITLRRPDAPDLLGPDVTSSQGVSIGRSPDEAATVAILGATGQESEASRLAEAFVGSKQEPTACVAGDIGAVVLDHISGAGYLVAARIGLRQVFWSVDGGHLRVGSNPGLFGDASGRQSAIDPNALFRYVYFHMSPGPSTFLRGWGKLDGGHWLRWDASGTLQERYWRPRFNDAGSISEADAVFELRRVLDESVRRSMGTRADVGAFLSGGLDSSTVAGFAAGHRPGIPTVTMGFDAAGYDETAYARIASTHFGTRPLEYYVSPADIVSTLPRLAAAFPEPFGNSSAAAAYHCARIAREDGLGLLLAGDGGDELFGGNDRYAKQLVFEHYSHVPRMFRQSLLEPLVAAAARVTTAYPFGKARSYLEQANVPLPDRLQSYNFLHRHDPVEVFTPGFLEQLDIGAPLRMWREEYGVPETQSAINRMLFLDWKFTLHDNDLVKVNTMCQFAGVDVAYPMLDQALVDFSLSLPPHWKVHNGQLRWFYKRAMRGFLPQQIIDKTKHGFGLPFGVWTRTHDGLRRLSEDALDCLSRRGFFRPGFLREVLRLHREGHASYYGELVWILMVLEFWLQAHMPGARS